MQKHHPKRTKKEAKKLLSRRRAPKNQKLRRCRFPPITQNDLHQDTQKAGIVETHEAAKNLALAATTGEGDEHPSKHCLFLSFQIAQMLATKEDCQSGFPLLDQNPNF